MTSKLDAIFKGCLVTLAAFFSASAANAQTNCDSFWTGSWDTSFGQLRLIEDGEFVYGDYGNLGTIKGRLDKVCGDWLRGVFERKDGRWGYFEFVETGDDEVRFSGRWTWSETTLPSWEHKSGGEWNGTVTDKYPPPILNFAPGESRDPMTKTPFGFQRWMDLVDRKAINAEREQAAADQKARIEANRQAAADRAAREAAEKAARDAARPPSPVSRGYALNDGYGSVLSVGPTFDAAKAQTAVSMQQHVQMVSMKGAAAVKAEYGKYDFNSIGNGVYEMGGVGEERLRMMMVRKGQSVIVTFRGTGGDTVWQTIANAVRSDARTKFVEPSFIPKNKRYRDTEGELLVHKGFYDSYMMFRSAIVSELGKQEKSNLFIFGHSLGGAMATLMAADMQTNYANKFATITHMVSGSPRVGNREFANYFARVVPDNLRLTVNKDPVPLIPGRGRKAGTAVQFDDYVHVGRMLAVQLDGKPIDGDDIRVDLQLKTIGGDFTTFHDNKYYLAAVANMRNRQPSNPKLSPNGNAWIADVANKERRRSK